MPACPNCGSKLESGKQHCPNCGAIQYPREALEDRKTKLRNWTFGRPLSRPVATGLLIVGGLATAFMGGCGLLVGLQGDEVVSGFGWGFAVLGFFLLAYVLWEARRAFKK